MSSIGSSITGTESYDVYPTNRWAKVRIDHSFLISKVISSNVDAAKIMIWLTFVPSPYYSLILFLIPLPQILDTNITYPKFDLIIHLYSKIWEGYFFTVRFCYIYIDYKITTHMAKSNAIRYNTLMPAFSPVHETLFISTVYYDI